MAQGKLSDWGNVEKLKAGTKIVVHTTKRQEIEGEVLKVTDEMLFLEVAKPFGDWQRVVLPREEVTEIRNRRAKHVNALIGAAIGIGVGVGIGAIYDSRHPFSDDPGIGKLTFGLLGGLAGVATGGSLPTKGRKIYVAP
jgi:uncharacterized transporter YbjL